MNRILVKMSEFADEVQEARDQAQDEDAENEGDIDEEVLDKCEDALKGLFRETFAKWKAPGEV